MASIRRMAPEPTLAQVRDYVLTMLEGLSSLAETVDDRHTGDRIRDLAHQLLMSWSPRCEVPLRQVQTAPRPDVAAEGPLAEAGRGDPPGRAADERARQGRPEPS